MARGPRKISESRIYHIMVRGNNRRNIFNDDQDKQKIIDILIEKKYPNAYDVYGYCIMDNHAHFILKELEKNISQSMKRINISYAAYFNKKHNTYGHVFQDRFKSQAVENDQYLLSVIRYIHMNPVKAGFTDCLEEYIWSSYRQFIQEKINSILIEYKSILSMFNDELDIARKAFVEFSNEDVNDQFIDLQEESIKKDDINKIVGDFLSDNNITLEEINNKNNIIYRKELILLLRENTDYSIRKMSELLDISRGTIYRLINNK